MVKYSLFVLIALISLAYVMSAPAANDEPVEAESAAIDPAGGRAIEVEDVQPSGSKKIKRGIYGGGYGLYGGGHYPYSYSVYPYGSYGGYGHGYGYGYYPSYSIGYHGYGHGHGYGGYGLGYLW